MVAKKSTAWRESLRKELAELWRRLEGYRVCVVVATNALRHQNAGLDVDVATALVRGAADPLHDEVERVAKWAQRLRREDQPKRRKAKSKTRR